MANFPANVDWGAKSRYSEADWAVVDAIFGGFSGHNPEIRPYINRELVALQGSQTVNRVSKWVVRGR